MSDKLTARQCLAHLWTYLKPHQRKLWIGLFLSVILQVIYAYMALPEAEITNQIQKDLTAMAQGVTGAHIQMDIIVRILWGLLLTYLLKITLQFVTNFLMTDSIQAAVYDVRKAVEKKINRLPVSYFDSHPAGDLLSRITNDVDTVSTALQQTLSQIISAVCTFCFSMFIMIQISLPMTGIVLIGLPCLAISALTVYKKSQPVYDAQQEALSELSSTVNELYTGCQEILAYNYQKQAKERFEKANRTMKENGFKAQWMSTFVSTSVSAVNYAVLSTCAVYGCFQVLNGAMMLGDLQAFIRYIWMVNDPVAQIGQLSSAIQSAFSGMNRLFTFLSLPEEERTMTKQPVTEIESVAFEHVEFSYHEQPLMKDLSFHVRSGQTAAIVGPTGAGKTTITNLLLRFYKPQSGKVKINSTDIQDLSFEDLRSLYGLVLQDPWLFEGTVADNLLYGCSEASRKDMVEAARKVGVHELIEQLPDGYDTMISEGAENISQGQKQLLTIVRSLIRDPKILILDEATSSVDTRIERRLQKAMDVLMESRTSFVIAHRLSTIVNADLILVVENGDIVEQGTHHQLLERNGRYARLYHSQFSKTDSMEDGRIQ